ncbi:hypothetical protein QVD17_38277 [Tagetes erecta]|uniref:Uncharacterized protein n=1 Tax=Tagetes erecta TaxID=13708 RepID=A0AAD8JZU8_TARER|nr:hypothetical protein QVD17_38277 [Tagetes erecta]
MAWSCDVSKLVLKRLVDHGLVRALIGIVAACISEAKEQVDVPVRIRAFVFKYEETGVKEMQNAAFVLLAGGCIG